MPPSSSILSAGRGGRTQSEHLMVQIPHQEKFDLFTGARGTKKLGQEFAVNL